jgi:hypothetical protein
MKESPVNRRMSAGRRVDSTPVVPPVSPPRRVGAPCSGPRHDHAERSTAFARPRRQADRTVSQTLDWRRQYIRGLSFPKTTIATGTLSTLNLTPEIGTSPIPGRTTGLGATEDRRAGQWHRHAKPPAAAQPRQLAQHQRTPQDARARSQGRYFNAELLQFSHRMSCPAPGRNSTATKPPDMLSTRRRGFPCPSEVSSENVPVPVRPQCGQRSARGQALDAFVNA